MVLVVGATGLVGSRICAQLAGQGERVRALVRTSSSPRRLEALRQAGCELHVGDLKEPASIAEACQGVDAVISTASCTLSRQDGDSIETVDRVGQLNLASAAKQAGVQRFIFVSVPRPAGEPFPLADAKAEVEAAISELNFTVIRPSWFMEVWLTPALGFDYSKAAATIYGPGTKPMSWVSLHDVADFCVRVLSTKEAERQTIAFGGPEALSPLEVVSRFENVGGRPFRVQHVPLEALGAQFAGAPDPMAKSFAGLMLEYAAGNAIEMHSIVDRYGLKLASVDDYARVVVGGD